MDCNKPSDYFISVIDIDWYWYIDVGIQKFKISTWSLILNNINFDINNEKIA